MADSANRIIATSTSGTAIMSIIILLILDMEFWAGGGSSNSS